MENTGEIAPTGIDVSGEQNHADVGAASSIHIISSLNSASSGSSSTNDVNSSNSYIGDSNALVGSNINISSNSYISNSNSDNSGGGGGGEDINNINNINNNVVLVSNSNSDSSYIDPNNISGMVGIMGAMQTGIIDPNNINVIVDPNQQMGSNQTYSYSTVVNADGSISNITYDGSGNIVYNTTTSANGSSSNPSATGTYSYDTSMGASSFQSAGIPIAMPIVSSYGMTSMPYNMNYATQNYGLSTQSNSGVSSSAAGSYASGTIGNSMGGVSGSSYASMPMSSSMYSHHHYGGASVVNTSVSGVNGGSISTSNPSSYMGQSSSVSYQPMRETGILNLSAESLPDDDSDLNLLTDAQHDERLFDMLHRFWETQTRDMNVLDISTEQDFKNHNDLPLARIKRIMKSDEDVRMISAEAPVLFAKACEMFILELSIRSWGASEKCKRRTLLKEDVDAAIKNTDIFDFLEGLS